MCVCNFYLIKTFRRFNLLIFSNGLGFSAIPRALFKELTRTVFRATETKCLLAFSLSLRLVLSVEWLEWMRLYTIYVQLGN